MITILASSLYIDFGISAVCNRLAVLSEIPTSQDLDLRVPTCSNIVQLWTRVSTLLRRIYQGRRWTVQKIFASSQCVKRQCSCSRYMVMSDRIPQRIDFKLNCTRFIHNAHRIYKPLVHVYANPMLYSHLLAEANLQHGFRKSSWNIPFQTLVPALGLPSSDQRVVPRDGLLADCQSRGAGPRPSIPSGSHL